MCTCQTLPGAIPKCRRVRSAINARRGSAMDRIQTLLRSPGGWNRQGGKVMEERVERRTRSEGIRTETTGIEAAAQRNLRRSAAPPPSLAPPLSSPWAVSLRRSSRLGPAPG